MGRKPHKHRESEGLPHIKKRSEAEAPLLTSFNVFNYVVTAIVGFRGRFTAEETWPSRNLFPARPQPVRAEFARGCGLNRTHAAGFSDAERRREVVCRRRRQTADRRKTRTRKPRREAAAMPTPTRAREAFDVLGRWTAGVPTMLFPPASIFQRKLFVL